MKRTRIPLALLLLLPLQGNAQEEVWSADRCMQYAVSHNRDVRQSVHTLDSYKSSRLEAAAAFLPAVSGGVNAQYNFGRAIDPETNTYTDVSTFYNNYSIAASIPIFDGLTRLHNLRAARADVLMGKSSLKAAEDRTALAVFQAFVDVLYYKGTERMALEKRLESELMLHQTRVMEEVGTKGLADVAQMEAQYATDDYDVTRQRNLLATALLTLKQEMNYPMDSPIELDTTLLERIVYTPHFESLPELYTQAEAVNPSVLQAEYALQSARHAHRAAKGDLYPSISFQAGISTSYYKTLHNPNAASFKDQFHNNRGEYIAFSLSIPIFDRLSTVSRIRRARNNRLIAEEQYEQTREELRKLVEQAVNDREGYLKETLQMEKKVASDSIAYRLTRRKYEEGLSSPIDVQTSAATLLQSRATLLQSRLLYLLKDRLVDYYKGESLIRNEE